MKTFEEVMREYAKHIAAEELREYAMEISQTCTFSKKVTWGTVQRYIRELAKRLDGQES